MTAICSPHLPYPPKTGCDRCDARAVTQMCAVCQQRLCPNCWGQPWMSLTCQPCRTRARTPKEAA